MKCALKFAIFAIFVSSMMIVSGSLLREAQAAEPVTKAQLLEIAGDVMVNHGTGFVVAKPGMALAPGARVLLFVGGQVKLAYSASCQIAVTAPGTFVVANAVPCPVGSTSQPQWTTQVVADVHGATEGWGASIEAAPDLAVTPEAAPAGGFSSIAIVAGGAAAAALVGVAVGSGGGGSDDEGAGSSASTSSSSPQPASP